MLFVNDVDAFGRIAQGKTIEMYMPALSSTMEEGTIVQWLKEGGDRIEVGGWLVGGGGP